MNEIINKGYEEFVWICFYRCYDLHLCNKQEFSNVSNVLFGVISAI